MRHAGKRFLSARRAEAEQHRGDRYLSVIPGEGKQTGKKENTEYTETRKKNCIIDNKYINFRKMYFIVKITKNTALENVYRQRKFEMLD